jgi:hypothetical protein
VTKPTKTAKPPKAAPNTGGGSASGADLRLVLLGSLLLLASMGLGLFTFRRSRRV